MKFCSDSDELFRHHFGRPSKVAAQAPGRINLIGEHIDYLDGWVLPAAIDRQLFASAAENGTDVVRVVSTRKGKPLRSADFSLDQLERRSDPDDSWLNYLIGVLAGYRRSGIECAGFDILLHSTLPSGAGLSSSAALETVTALIVEALTGIPQDPIDRALICQQAEHDFAGVPCGIMDQLAVGASCENHALQIDCRDLSLKHIAIPDELSLVVFDTGVKHALGDGEYRKRREDCEQALRIMGGESFRELTIDQINSHQDTLDERLFRRCRHAVTEMARVQQFSAALEAGAVDALGPLMQGSHNSLRNDFEVSCRELDFLVESATDFGFDRGLLGSRMTGAGFGGSTVSLVQREACDELIDHLKSQFTQEFHPTYELNAFPTHAAAAASIIAVH